MQSPERPDSHSPDAFDAMWVSKVILTILWALTLTAGLVAWCFG